MSDSPQQQETPKTFVLNERLKAKSKPKSTKTPPINSISFVVPNKIRDH